MCLFHTTLVLDFFTFMRIMKLFASTYSFLKRLFGSIDSKIVGDAGRRTRRKPFPDVQGDLRVTFLDYGL